MPTQVIGAVYGSNYLETIEAVYCQSYIIPAWHGSPTGVSLRVTYTSGQGATQTDLRFAIYVGGTADDPTGAVLVEEWVENTQRADWDAPTFTLSGSYQAGAPIWVVVKGAVGSGRVLGNHNETPDWGPSNGWFISSSSINNDPAIAFPSAFPTEGNPNGGTKIPPRWFKWELTYTYTDLSPYIDSHSDVDYIAAIGDTVTAYGANFGSIQGTNDALYLIDSPDWASRTVQVPANIASWSDTAITFTVPTVPSYGSYWLVVVKNEGQADEMVGSKVAQLIVENGPPDITEFTDFDDGTLGAYWQNTTADDTEDWAVVSGSGSPYGVGPSADKSGTGQYAQFLAATLGGTANLETVNLYNGSTHRVYIGFWRNLKWYFSSGYDAGLFKLQAWDGAAWVDVIVHDQADAYQDAGDSDVWIYEVADLSAFTNSDLKIRFRHQDSSQQYTGLSPAGIDEVSIFQWGKITYKDAAASCSQSNQINAAAVLVKDAYSLLNSVHQLQANGLLDIPVDAAARLDQNNTVSANTGRIRTALAQLDQSQAASPKPSLFISQQTALDSQQALNAKADGGRPVPVKQALSFDIADELLADIRIPSALSRKQGCLSVPVSIELIPTCRSEINSGAINQQPVNQCQQPSPVVELSWPFDQNYRLGDQVQWLIQHYERCTDLTAKTQWLEQTYSIRALQFEFSQTYDLDSSGPNLRELALDQCYSLASRPFALAFLDYLNAHRASYGLAPIEGLWIDRDRQSGPDIASIHSRNMAAIDVLAHNSLLLPIGWQYTDERLDHLYIEGATVISESILATVVSQAMVANGVDAQTPIDSRYHPLTPYELFYRLINSPTEGAALLYPFSEEDHPLLMLGYATCNATGAEFVYQREYTTIAIIGYSPPEGSIMADLYLDQHYSLSAALIEFLDQSYPLDANPRVYAHHECVYSIEIAVQHEAVYSAIIAVQHIAPIHYSVGSAHEALYSSTITLYSAHEASYDILFGVLIAAQHEAIYSESIYSQHEGQYRDTQLITAAHEAQYDAAPLITASHEAQYSNNRIISVAHTALFTDFNLLIAWHELQLNDRQLLFTSHEAQYSDRDLVSTEFFALLDDLDILVIDHHGLLDDRKSLLVAHEAQYGDKSLIFIDYAGLYDDRWLLLAQHELQLDDLAALTAKHEALHDDIQLISVAHEAQYEAAPLLVALHEVHLDDLAILSDQHDAVYSSTTPVYGEHEAIHSLNEIIQAQHEASYGQLIAVYSEHQAIYDLLGFDEVFASHAAYYAIGGYPAHLVQFDLSVWVGSEQIEAGEVVISTSEADPLWQCKLSLLATNQAYLFHEGAQFKVLLNGEEYQFIYHRKIISRSGDSTPSITIEGLSPAMQLASPRAKAIDVQYDAASPAQSIIEDILGQPVIWDIPSWTIKPFRVAAQSAIPLDFAGDLINRVGGVIESLPDGRLRVRKKYPVNPPAYETAVPDQVYSDFRDNLSASENYEPRKRYNRFRVTEADPQYSDKIEFVQDEQIPEKGLLRAYPSPWRENIKIRSTDGLIYVANQGWLSEEREEVIEFKEGSAQTAYPIEAIIHIEWLSDVLGGLSFSPYDTKISTSTDVNQGYGLAKVTYITRFMQCETVGQQNREAQYVIEEI